MNRLIGALNECSTPAEAKELARSMRLTAISVEKAHGADHAITKVFKSRYDDFIDEMAFKFGQAVSSSNR